MRNSQARKILKVTPACEFRPNKPTSVTGITIPRPKTIHLAVQAANFTPASSSSKPHPLPDQHNNVAAVRSRSTPATGKTPEPAHWTHAPPEGPHPPPPPSALLPSPHKSIFPIPRRCSAAETAIVSTSACGGNNAATANPITAPVPRFFCHQRNPPSASNPAPQRTHKPPAANAEHPSGSRQSPSPGPDRASRIAANPQPRPSCPRAVPPQPPRQRSPHPTAADNSRPAAPDPHCRPPPASPRPPAAHPSPSAHRTAPAAPPAMPLASNTPAASSHTATRSGAGFDRRKLLAFRPATPWAAAQSPPAAETPRPDAHPAPHDGTPDFRDSTSSREIATTGICAGSASPFTALSPTRTPVKLPGPFTATIPPSSFSLIPAPASTSLTAATSVAE